MSECRYLAEVTRDREAYIAIVVNLSPKRENSNRERAARPEAKDPDSLLTLDFKKCTTV